MSAHVSTRSAGSIGRSRRASVVLHALVYALAGVMMIPFVWLICGAFKRSEDFFSGMFLPRGDGFLGVAWSRLTLDNFRNLLADGSVLGSMLNSVFLSSVTAVGATLVCAAAGYALAKHRFPGRTLITAVVLSAVIVPPTLVLAPGFKLLFDLHLLDTYAGLIVPALAPAFGVYLFRQASLTGVPDELIEAARIDGCGELRIFFTVALPLLRPMMGAFVLITFLGVWNNFIQPQVVLQSQAKFPLAVTVAQLKGVYYQDYGLQIAGVVVSIVPVLGLFLLLQREFISGLTSGAVKE